MSKWSVSPDGNFFHNQQVFTNRPLRILHLDDHQLYARGLKDCIMPFFPLAEIINYCDGDDALASVKTQLLENVPIDCIITDIHHPGLKGDRFLHELRLFEKKNHLQRIPALILTMEESPAIRSLTRSRYAVADAYLGKVSEPDVIINTLENILYADKKGH